jgi:hypothetical protein
VSSWNFNTKAQQKVFETQRLITLSLTMSDKEEEVRGG